MWTFLQRVCLGAVLLLAAPAALCSPADDFQRLSEAAASKAIRAAERRQIVTAVEADAQLLELCWQELERAKPEGVSSELRLALSVLTYRQHPRTLAAMRKLAGDLPTDKYFGGDVVFYLKWCAGEKFEAKRPADYESLSREEQVRLVTQWFDKGGEAEFEPSEDEKWTEFERVLELVLRELRGEDVGYRRGDLIEASAHTLAPLTHNAMTFATADRLVGAMERLVSVWCEACDEDVSQAASFVLHVFQHNFGVVGLRDDVEPRRRDVVETLARNAITQWKAFREERAGASESESLLVWRMRRLHAAGYGSEPGSKQVVQELLRAIRAGSVEEAKTASDVTQQLGLSTSIVPIGEANTVSDALLRGIVVEQVVDSLVAGKRVVWDDVEKRWRVEMGADRWP